MSFEAEALGDVDGTREMEVLCDDNDGLDLKNVTGAVKGVVRVETGVIHKDILGGDFVTCEIVFHGLDFVVICLAVIAGDENLGRGALFVERKTCVEAIFKYPR